MSDLFIGEILVLSLLLPVLLRPFLRRLQRIEGIALLPFFSLLMCVAVITALGFRVSFIPVLTFSGLVFISSLSRSVRLMLRLPTDLYSHLSVVYSCFLFVLYVGALWFAVSFAPEVSYFTGKPVHRSVFVQKTALDRKALYTVLTPVDQSAETGTRPVVILLGDITTGSGGRNTTAWILAENGYIVVAADFRAKGVFNNALFSFPALRKILSLVGRIDNLTFLNPAAEETELLHSEELRCLTDYSRKMYGPTVPLFIVTEGSSCLTGLARINQNYGSIAGLVCIVPDSSVPALPLAPENFVAITTDTGLMPNDAGAKAVLVMSGSPAQLYGYGEIAADDVLAATLLGGKRDEGRKMAELTGRRILSWLTLRGNYDHQ